MALEKSSSSAVLDDQNDWSKKLANVELEDLKEVCKLAIRRHSTVSLVRIDSHPNARFALKTIKKAKLKDMNKREMVLSEKKILSEAKNDFIVKLYRTFKDDDCLYLLMEYLPGGHVLDLAPLSENAAKFYIASVIEALDYLHTRDIVYNDVSSLNLVLDTNGYAKLISFGLAMQLEKNQKSYGNTSVMARYDPHVLPPEIVFAFPSLDKDDPEVEGWDRACDLWALGVFLFELLNNFTPFDPTKDASLMEVLCNITEGIDSFPFSREDFSEEAEDLIRNLCAYDAEHRLGYESIDEIREHRWFDDFDWSKFQQRKLTPPNAPEVLNIIFLPEKFSESDLEVEEDMSDSSDWYNDF